VGVVVVATKIISRFEKEETTLVVEPPFLAKPVRMWLRRFLKLHYARL
jgi:hypothetical protein